MHNSSHYLCTHAIGRCQIGESTLPSMRALPVFRGQGKTDNMARKPCLDAVTHRLFSPYATPELLSISAFLACASPRVSLGIWHDPICSLENTLVDAPEPKLAGRPPTIKCDRMIDCSATPSLQSSRSCRKVTIKSSIQIEYLRPRKVHCEVSHQKRCPCT